MELNDQYWEQRYQDGSTGWDIGYPSRPIQEFVDQLSDKNLRILIPGGGNGYEAAYLFEQGFTNVHLLDFAASPLKAFQAKVPNFPPTQLIQEDFFQHQGQYDLIIEQTFYCAIDPKLRDDYVQKMHELLPSGGRLAGLLWGVPMNSDRPPYGGNKEEYQTRFAKYFEIEQLEVAPNSIPPRAGRELFIIARNR